MQSECVNDKVKKNDNNDGYDTTPANRFFGFNILIYIYLHYTYILYMKCGMKMENDKRRAILYK